MMLSAVSIEYCESLICSTGEPKKIKNIAAHITAWMRSIV